MRGAAEILPRHFRGRTGDDHLSADLRNSARARRDRPAARVTDNEVVLDLAHEPVIVSVAVTWSPDKATVAEAFNVVSNFMHPTDPTTNDVDAFSA